MKRSIGISWNTSTPSVIEARFQAPTIGEDFPPPSRIVILDDGEFVARWETCPECEGQSARDFGPNCKRCGNNGCVLVPVEERGEEGEAGK